MNRRIRNFKSRTFKKFRQSFKSVTLKVMRKWKNGGTFSKTSDSDTTIEVPGFDGSILPTNETRKGVLPGEIPTNIIHDVSDLFINSLGYSKCPPINAQDIISLQYSLDSIELLNLKLKEAIEAENYAQAQTIQNEINRRNNE